MERGHKPSRTKQELQNVRTFNILSESSNESSLLDARYSDRASVLNLFKPCRPFTRVPLACDQSWHWSHCPQQGGESQGDPSKFDPPENLLVPICTVRGDMNPIVFNRPETASFPKRG